jgi:hypothetical protein
MTENAGMGQKRPFMNAPTLGSAAPRLRLHKHPLYSRKRRFDPLIERGDCFSI